MERDRHLEIMVLYRHHCRQSTGEILNDHLVSMYNWTSQDSQDCVCRAFPGVWRDGTAGGGYIQILIYMPINIYRLDNWLGPDLLLNSHLPYYKETNKAKYWPAKFSILRSWCYQDKPQWLCADCLWDYPASWLNYNCIITCLLFITLGTALHYLECCLNVPCQWLNYPDFHPYIPAPLRAGSLGEVAEQRRERWCSGDREKKVPDIFSTLPTRTEAPSLSTSPWAFINPVWNTAIS